MGLNKPIHFTDIASSTRDIVNLTTLSRILDAIVQERETNNKNAHRFVSARQVEPKGHIYHQPKEIDPQAAEIDITDHTRQQNSYELNGKTPYCSCSCVWRKFFVAMNRQKRITGHNTPAILVVVYGNQDYDDALLELKTTMESNGFQTVACIACIAEHSIMGVYAKGRPDSDDETILRFFRTNQN